MILPKWENYRFMIDCNVQFLFAPLSLEIYCQFPLGNITPMHTHTLNL